MDYLKKIIGDFETHSVDGIKECFEHGVDPNLTYKGKPIIYELINMYLRSPNFKYCVSVFVDFGLKFDDKLLLAVLLDDADTLNELLDENKKLVQSTYTFAAAFTPIEDASLLHICAEYNHVASAKVLIRHGINVNVKAGIDENGFGGHTAIFHTVNQHQNNSLEMMNYLLSENADLEITVSGLVWGKGYDWETFIPSVNPVSYAMMGLLPQFQRKENQVYETVEILMKVKYGIAYQPKNIPNKYLEL